MARAIKTIDITDVPELVRIAEEVARTGEARVLRRDSEDVAVLMPMSSSVGRPRSEVTGRAGGARRRFTIESAAGSVQPATATEDFERIIQEAKEERAERSVDKLHDR